MCEKCTEARAVYDYETYDFNLKSSLVATRSLRSVCEIAILRASQFGAMTATRSFYFTFARIKKKKEPPTRMISRGVSAGAVLVPAPLRRVSPREYRSRRRDTTGAAGRREAEGHHHQRPEVIPQLTSPPYVNGRKSFNMPPWLPAAHYISMNLLSRRETRLFAGHVLPDVFRARKLICPGETARHIS